VLGNVVLQIRIRFLKSFAVHLGNPAEQFVFSVRGPADLTSKFRHGPRIGVGRFLPGDQKRVPDRARFLHKSTLSDIRPLMFDKHPFT